MLSFLHIWKRVFFSNQYLTVNILDCRYTPLQPITFIRLTSDATKFRTFEGSEVLLTFEDFLNSSNLPDNFFIVTVSSKSTEFTDLIIPLRH